MKLETVFLLVHEHPQQLMFVCPLCDRQNFTPPPKALTLFRCAGCGSALDAHDADLEILANEPHPDTQPALWT
jgi:hypothetical protein